MTVYWLGGIFAVLAASIWLAWYLDRKKAQAEAAPGPKISLLNRLRPSLVESTTMCVQLFYVCHGRKH